MITAEQLSGTRGRRDAVGSQAMESPPAAKRSRFAASPIRRLWPTPVAAAGLLPSPSREECATSCLPADRPIRRQSTPRLVRDLDAAIRPPRAGPPARPVLVRSTTAAATLVRSGVDVGALVLDADRAALLGGGRR